MDHRVGSELSVGGASSLSADRPCKKFTLAAAVSYSLVVLPGELGPRLGARPVGVVAHLVLPYVRPSRLPADVRQLLGGQVCHGVWREHMALVQPRHLPVPNRANQIRTSDGQRKTP
eukprot:1904821-Pyramimonas_sp.AAC.1